MTDPQPAVSARRGYAVLVLGWAAFTLYGSLVPLQFHPRPWPEARADFARAMRERVRITSRSDAVANVMLGVPLGFGLLACLCVDRRLTAGATALRGLALMPVCILFAASVEFLQVYFPLRTCAGSDVLCQATGAAIGMTLWIVWGQRLTEHARIVWGGSGLGDTAGRLLVAYLAVLVLVQVLPLDLTASPKDIYKKLRDRVEFVPFGELFGTDNPTAWSRIARCLQVVGLYVPVGLLASRIPGRFWSIDNFGRLFGLALALALVLEGLQLWVQSRTPSATDVFVGTAGMLIGALIGWSLPRELRFTDVVGLGSWWLIMMGLISWQPIPFQVQNPPQRFDWVPGMPLEGGNPLFAMEQMLTKLVLFGLAGAIVAGCVKANGYGLALLVGLAISALFEAGQTVFGTHTPCITDVLLGGMGAAIGVWVMVRVNADTARK